MSTADASGDVLFVVMDTVRKDHLSVYGYDRPTTPNLEAFAADATVFEQAVAPAPWTLPVHASLFTGLYPSQHGASQETPYLEGATTLAETLSDSHATSCYSSNAWITPYTHLTDGFDDQDNFFEMMPGGALSGPIARAWKALNDNDSLRRVADWMVSVGNRFHEYFASAEGADSKTPQVIDATAEFVESAAARDEPFFSFVNLMDAPCRTTRPRSTPRSSRRASTPPRCARTPRSTTAAPATSTTRSGRTSRGCTTPRFATSTPSWAGCSTRCAPRAPTRRR